MKPSYRELVHGLGKMVPVTIRGQEYTGQYFATLMAIDPEIPDAEAALTPQVMAEVGRLLAAAWRDKEQTDLDYRIWRDGTVHRLTNDLAAAAAAGFESATDPGTDSKGKPKDAKCPSVASVEAYLRTCPEYTQHYARKLAAEEAWQTVNYVYEAAKARTWAVRGFVGAGSEVASGSALRGDSPRRIERDVAAMEEAAYPKQAPQPPLTNRSAPPPPPRR